MMGKKDFKPRIFYRLSLETMVPQDHLVRALEGILDLEFVRGICRRYYSHTGQPSVDPVVLFKMMLIGYLFGITSERKLAEECTLNLAFRWYLGYDLDEATPHHSVISKARARFGKRYDIKTVRKSSRSKHKSNLDYMSCTDPEASYIGRIGRRMFLYVLEEWN